MNFLEYFDLNKRHKKTDKYTDIRKADININIEIPPFRAG